MNIILIALAYLVVGFIVLNIESILAVGWERVRDSYTWERFRENRVRDWLFTSAYLILWPLVVIGWAGDIADETLAWLSYHYRS